MQPRLICAFISIAVFSVVAPVGDAQEKIVRNQLTVKSKFFFPGNPVRDIIPFLERVSRVQIDVTEAGARLDREIKFKQAGKVYELMTEMLSQADLKWIGHFGVIHVIPLTPTDPKIDPENTSGELKAVLNDLMAVDFEDTSIEKVIKEFQNRFVQKDVKLIVDKQKIMEAKIDLTRKLTNYDGTSVTKYLLTDLLNQADLTWKIQNDSVLIIPKEKTIVEKSN